MLDSKSPSAAFKRHGGGRGGSSTLVVLANDIVRIQKSAMVFGNSMSLGSYFGGARCADLLVFYDISIFSNCQTKQFQNSYQSLRFSSKTHPNPTQNGEGAGARCGEAPTGADYTSFHRNKYERCAKTFFEVLDCSDLFECCPRFSTSNET